jgi:zinc/manganese transport system substrate-binding protein
MTRWYLALCFGLSLVATNALAADRPKVVASFSVLGDMVREVAGGRAQITTLVGPNGDAHVFEPSPADARTLAEANLVIVNGLGLEPWMDRLIKSTAYRGPVAVASQGVVSRTMSEAESGSSAPKTVTDPHAWQDLRNGQIYVRNIAAALAKVDPGNAKTYQANAVRYEDQLAELDNWVRNQIDMVPQAKRRVITSHDAFGYFGAAYGVEFLAPVGISTEAEPTAGQLAGLIDQIKRERINTLFIENITDPRLVETIGKESGAQMGGELYSDALSEPDGPAPSYIAMFKNNVPKLVDGMLMNGS